MLSRSPSLHVRPAVAALALLMTLGGCSGRPSGFLGSTSAVAPPPGASRVDMLVATTRSPEDAPPGEFFTGERGRGLAFADIALSLPPDSVREIGEVQWPSSAPGDPAKDFVVLHARQVDSATALAQFRGRIAKIPGRRVLVFVHGYNTRFEEAVYRFAQISHDSGAPALPILFTWPSRGRLLAYTYDRESATYSRDALEGLLQALARDKDVSEITLLAHSMGNWVALEALHQMAVRNGRIAPKIANIMLAAPDVDIDVFRRDIAGLGDNHPPITMFVSRDDKALAFSRRLWGDVVRAGAIDPEAEPYRTELAKARVTTVDLSNVKSADALNHSKFAESPEIVRMIGARLVAGQTLTDSRSGLGEKIGAVTLGAASTVGSAAGVVLSAPIAIVDPQTRESLGERARAVGDGVSDTLTSTVDVARPQR